MSKFEIDWWRLAVILLPLRLRNKPIVHLLYAALEPLRTGYAKFMLDRKANLNDLQTQQWSVNKALNDRFDKYNGRLTVEMPYGGRVNVYIPYILEGKTSEIKLFTEQHVLAGIEVKVIVI
jgi:hypothetical protein